MLSRGQLRLVKEPHSATYIHPFFFFCVCVFGLITSCALWFTWGNALARRYPSFLDSCTSINWVQWARWIVYSLTCSSYNCSISPGIMRKQAELASCILIPGSFMHLQWICRFTGLYASLTFPRQGSCICMNYMASVHMYLDLGTWSQFERFTGKECSNDIYIYTYL